MSVGLKSFGSRLGDLEVIATVTWLGPVLLFDVCLDDFVRNVTTRRYEIASGPQMATPKLLFQMRELHQQFPRALTLDVLHDLARRNAWGTR